MKLAKREELVRMKKNSLRNLCNGLGVRHLNTEQIEYTRTHLLESPMAFLARETGVDFI